MKILFKNCSDCVTVHLNKLFSEMNFSSSILDVGHQNEKEFNSNMAMAKIFFAGMVSGLTEKMRTDSKSY